MKTVTLLAMSLIPSQKRLTQCEIVPFAKAKRMIDVLKTADDLIGSLIWLRNRTYLLLAVLRGSNLECGRWVSGKHDNTARVVVDELV